MRKVLALALTTVMLALFLAGCAEEQPQGDTGVAGGSATQAEPENPGATTVSGSTESTTAGAATATTTTGTTVFSTTGGTTSGTTGGTTVGETTSSGTTSDTSPSGAAQALGDATTLETTRQLSGEDVTVGGVVVEDPGFPEFTVPEATVPQEAAGEYLGKVRPIIEGSTRDVSGLLGSEASVREGDLTLSVGADTLENARSDVQNGLDRLRGVQAPENLQPIDEQLISSYERGLSAYNSLLDAVESGESQRVTEAVQNSLPRIERFNAETAAIVQSLEQGAGSQ